jgi:hypothetical protein
VLIEVEDEPAPADRPGHVMAVAGVTRVLVGLVALERLGFWRAALPEFRSWWAHDRWNWDAELGE